ncbi:hypothetical protein [Nostoc sp. NMS4]|uniref:hypothetical protein n=1 Tax=Nostoc sp. NMS4 TaxID=2815390 RepID=UPI0025EE877E|nr:hypothetical protein [Nostoc sp. NMS4]MBN3926400.1 hypothetical protein [Nostoc sp. NMS4]
MSQFPDDDKNLVNFLRQHRPPVLPPSPDLEQQILQQVQTSTVKPQRRLTKLWLVPSVIAASLVAAVVSDRVVAPAKPNAAELANLEAFIDSNWQGTVSEHTESYVWHFTDDSAD